MTRLMLTFIVLSVGCSQGVSPGIQHVSSCTPGTKDERCELARCLSVEPDVENLRVMVTNHCPDPVVFQESEDGEVLPGAGGARMTPYWRVRVAETGEPLNTSFQIPAYPIQPGSSDHALELQPGSEGVVALPGLDLPLFSCDGSRVIANDVEVIASLILVAPPTELTEAVKENQAEPCHASHCSVPNGTKCEDLPNRVVFEDVVTFTRE